MVYKPTSKDVVITETNMKQHALLYTIWTILAGVLVAVSRFHYIVLKDDGGGRTEHAIGGLNPTWKGNKVVRFIPVAVSLLAAFFALAASFNGHPAYFQRAFVTAFLAAGIAIIVMVMDFTRMDIVTDECEEFRNDYRQREGRESECTYSGQLGSLFAGVMQVLGAVYIIYFTFTYYTRGPRRKLPRAVSTTDDSPPPVSPRPTGV